VAVTELIVVRHGESLGNVAADKADAEQAETVAVDERDADVPLTSRGEAQAAALGDWLSGLGAARTPTAVLCSPYMRARQTAEIALQRAGQTPAIRLDERLRDRELGILDRLTTLGIHSRFPDEAQRRAHLGKFYYRPPGGESWADVCLRLRPVLAEVDADSGNTHGTMLIVCHDAVIFLIRYLLEELTEREVLDIAAARSLGNGAVTTFTRHDAGTPWSLGVFDVRDHLVAAGVEATTHAGARDDAHLG
jgi:broad specificity phosphatase PhoE